jgi:hypothetical protein
MPSVPKPANIADRTKSDQIGVNRSNEYCFAKRTIHHEAREERGEKTSVQNFVSFVSFVVKIRFCLGGGGCALLWPIIPVFDSSHAVEP